MTEEFKRVSATEWAWVRGKKHFTVRYFGSTERLIWSGWMQTNNAPEFDAGVAQSVAEFLENGAPSHVTPPDALLTDLRASLTQSDTSEPKRKGFFRRLFNS